MTGAKIMAPVVCLVFVLLIFLLSGNLIEVRGRRAIWGIGTPGERKLLRNCKQAVSCGGWLMAKCDLALLDFRPAWWANGFYYNP